MDGKGYATHVLPLIASHLRYGMVFIQDGSSVHTSDDALRKIAQLGLEPIPWPANSPDLNPIETI
jgi:transposase